MAGASRSSIGVHVRVVPGEATVLSMPKRKQARNVENPLLDQQTAFLAGLSPTERDGFFSTALEPEHRARVWMEQADIGEQLVNDYAWATPDARALRILRHFAPIVEIGCGRGYWCSQMQAAGIDVIGFDADPRAGGAIDKKKQKSWFNVKKGGPEVLKDHLSRTLFLCYPDEDETDTGLLFPDGKPMSLGSACIAQYAGDYIIHVGELCLDATLAVDQAPWGRSSSPEFQQQLMSEFHCLLKVALPSWLHVRDTLSVWKRSSRTTLVFAGDASEDDSVDEEVDFR